LATFAGVRSPRPASLNATITHLGMSTHRLLDREFVARVTSRHVVEEVLVL
jgi:hypothetical protein